MFLINVSVINLLCCENSVCTEWKVKLCWTMRSSTDASVLVVLHEVDTFVQQAVLVRLPDSREDGDSPVHCSGTVDSCLLAYWLLTVCVCIRIPSTHTHTHLWSWFITPTLAGVIERVKEGREVVASCSGSRVVINNAITSPGQDVEMCTECERSSGFHAAQVYFCRETTERRSLGRHKQTDKYKYISISLKTPVLNVKKQKRIKAKNGRKKN